MMPDQAPVREVATQTAPVGGAVFCPECSLPAWVEWRDTARSTSGPVDLVKLRCFARHWFLMPAAGLDWGLDTI